MVLARWHHHPRAGPAYFRSSDGPPPRPWLGAITGGPPAHPLAPTPVSRPQPSALETGHMVVFIHSANIY